MGRFSVIKSKGKFYVVAKDTNSLGGGPYATPEDAAVRSDALNVIEVAQAVELKKRQAAADANQMAITPGYRSPDVEDGRLAPQPIRSSWAPNWWQGPSKLGGRPPRGPASPGSRHPIPVDPAEDAQAMANGLRAAREHVQATDRSLGTPGGMFDWAPGSTGFAPSVPGAVSSLGSAADRMGPTVSPWALPAPKHTRGR